MDRRNGGDPLAPPRPPKSIPRVHRQRAPEPTIMSTSTNQHQQQPHQSFNVEATQTSVRPPLQPRNLQQSQTPPPIPPLQNHPQHQHQHQQINFTQSQHPQNQQQQPTSIAPVLTQPPITLPLFSLQTGTSFSRRRPPPPGTAIPTISSLTPNSIGHTVDVTSISPVTLAAPRPETERLGNEYVDTPFRTPKLGARLQHHGLHSAHAATTTASPTTTTTTTTPAPTLSSSGTNTAAHSGDVLVATTTTTKPIVPHGGAVRPSVLAVSAITKQPLPFTKDQMTEALHEDVDIHPSNGVSLNSITCPQCKRCRCEECQRPRQLPSRWVCDNTCLCSAETIIDYTSCLCCVKALFYHCSKDHEMECEGDSISCADDPCSCLPHKRTQRWAWLSALSLALPCLWCYWPMRGCVAMCAKCYARHSRHGCRCPHNGINNSGVSVGRTIIRSSDLTPEKRLLDSSPEF